MKNNNVDDKRASKIVHYFFQLPKTCSGAWPKMNIYRQLSFVKKTTWEEILSTWKKDEVDQLFWQNIYKKYGSWEKWREQCLANDELPHKNWELYKINDPVKFAQHVYCGSFDTWFKHYTKEKFPSKEERDHSYLGKIVVKSTLRHNSKILNILQNFPKKSQVLGITDGRRIMLYEGHHRCSALVLAAANHTELNVDFKIALSTYSTVAFENIFYPKGQ